MALPLRSLERRDRDQKRLDRVMFSAVRDTLGRGDRLQLSDLPRD